MTIIHHGCGRTFGARGPAPFEVFGAALGSWFVCFTIVHAIERDPQSSREEAEEAVPGVRLLFCQVIRRIGAARPAELLDDPAENNLTRETT
jgi:hypothetical protein